MYDITEKYPETIDVFVSHGFTQLANEKMRKLMGKTISLEMALKTKKVNVELFTQKLIDVIEQNRESIDDSLTLQEEKEGSRHKDKWSSSLSSKNSSNGQL